MKPEDSLVREIAVGLSAVDVATRPDWGSLARSTTAVIDRPFLGASRTTKPHFVPLVLLALLLVLVPTMTTVAMEEVRLQCTPRKFDVVPGEPMRLEVTVRAHDAAPVRLHVPDDPLLTVRAIEKPPVRRTEQGEIIHRRVVIWQALEPGLVKMKSLSVEVKGRKLSFPEITISVRDPGP